MLEAFIQGAAGLLQPTPLLMVLLGVIAGLILGIIPGIGSMVGVVLVMPFIYKMDPWVALPFILALMTVTFTAGSISAILINIPGTPPNAATLIDGFPMTRKGEGGRAIGAAVMASMAGGVAGVPLSLVMIPLIIPLVLAFGWAELFIVILMGLSFIALLAGGSAIKGLISGATGLIFSFVGLQALSGYPRLTFGTLFLYDGFHMIPLFLGFFGMAELIDMLVRRETTIAQVEITKLKLSDIFEGAKDVFRHWGLWLRCTIIGHIVGVIPGTGAQTATFVCYGQAKAISKNPEKFGTGCVEGVIAPESANNAKEAGSLLTTLSFGIPGSPVMALLLGVFMLLGLQPGPGMLLEHLDLSMNMMLTIVVANIAGGVICFFAAPYLARVAKVRMDFLFPVILVFVFFGAYAPFKEMLDLIVALFFGVLGFFMIRFGYSRAALVLGYVLGYAFEFYLFLGLKTGGALFFASPIGLVLIAIIVRLYAYHPLRPVFARWFRRGKKA